MWYFISFEIVHFYMLMRVLYVFIPRAEGSSKIHSRLEQQTSRFTQQMRSTNSSSSSSNKSSTSSKSSPPKEKTSPASPMDDIERGDMVLGEISSTEVTLNLLRILAHSHLWEIVLFLSVIVFNCLVILNKSSFCLCTCGQSWWQRRGSWTRWAAVTARQTPTAPRLPAVTTAPAAVTRRTNGLLHKHRPRPITACLSSTPARKPTVATRRVEEDSWTLSVSSLRSLSGIWAVYEPVAPLSNASLTMSAILWEQK